MACQPSKYDDLGKDAKDLLNKNYLFNVLKLDAKTKAKNGVEFTTNGSHNTDTGKVAGGLETKYKYTEYGVTFLEKWNTDNVLSTEVTIEDQLTKGTKLTFDTQFSPNSGKRAARVKSAYKHDYFHSTADVDFDFAGPTVHGSTVFGYKGWLAGYQASYDTASSKLAASNVAVGFKSNDFVLHSSVLDASKFVGSLHHRVNNKLEVGSMLQWNKGSNGTTFTLGGKYELDKDCMFKAKVNNSLHVGFSYIQTLRPGVKLTLSALVDAKNLDQSGHKLGLGLDFQA